MKKLEETAKDYKSRKDAYKKMPRNTDYKRITNKLNDDFVYKLKKDRLKEGITQKEMAYKIGMSYDKYKKFESGEMKLFSNKLISNLRAFDYKILSPNKEVLEC